MAVPAGQKILAGLIERADVLIDNFKLGTLEKWGFTDAWFDAARAAAGALLDHRLRHRADRRRRCPATTSSCRPSPG